jgi:Ca2+-binding EF-hand superfamily protein
MSSSSRQSRFDVALSSSLDDEDLSDEELQTPFSPSAALRAAEAKDKSRAAAAHQPEDKYLLVKESRSGALAGSGTERSQLAHTFELFGVDSSKGAIHSAQVARLLKQIGYASPDMEYLSARLQQLHSQAAPEPPKAAPSSTFSSLASPLVARQRKFSFSNSLYSPRKSSDGRGPAAAPLISLTPSNAHSVNPLPQLNFHQFLTLLQDYKPQNGMKARQLMRTFELLDIGNTGLISIDMLRRRMNSLANGESDGLFLSEAEFDRLVKFAISNGAVPLTQPGMIDYRKFVFKLVGTNGEEEEEEENN